MRNYYDDLEVSKTASKEVIEKVYKVLAKKYHPDATKEEDKKAAEEKFKIISEAYETLSDDEKRKNYDISLEESNPSISYEEYLSVVEERNALSNALNNVENEYNQFKNLANMNQYKQNSNYRAPYQETNYIPQNENTANNYAQANSNTVPQNKRTYYYTATGKPASAFDYFKYRIKRFISNMMLAILLVIVLILMINYFLSVNVFDLFIK